MATSLGALPMPAVARLADAAHRRPVTTDLDRVETLMHALAGDPAEDGLAAMAAEHLATGGKRLRARLALGAVEALGGRARDGVAWAAACELLHNATLVHDDLQDGDRVRRGHPTVWARHGMAQAVNVGDLLLMLPVLALEHADASPAVRWKLARLLTARAAEVVRGQALEMTLLPRRRFDLESYVAATEGKTAALFGLPVAGAAVLTRLDDDSARRVVGPFNLLGLLFQMQDDVLDLYGDKGRGQAGCDLREGKVSALVVEHLARHPDDAAWLVPLLESPRDEVSDAAVARACEAFQKGGALHAVLDRIAWLHRAIVTPERAPVSPALQQVAADLADRCLAPILPVYDEESRPCPSPTR